MTKLEKIVYTAKVHTSGGRENGVSNSADGRLNVKLSTPGSMEEGTNPEQLFGAGWSACFLSAIKGLAARKRINLPEEIAIDAEIDLGLTHGVHGLAARLNVSLPGMDLQAARALVDGAHEICPYSRATRGNIEVAISVATPEVMTQHEEVHK